MNIWTALIAAATAQVRDSEYLCSSVPWFAKPNYSLTFYTAVGVQVFPAGSRDVESIVTPAREILSPTDLRLVLLVS